MIVIAFAKSIIFMLGKNIIISFIYIYISFVVFQQIKFAQNAIGRERENIMNIV